MEAAGFCEHYVIPDDPYVKMEAAGFCEHCVIPDDPYVSTG
jgi:hypothetical protein